MLGPTEYGKYMYAISYVSVIAVLFEGGIDILTVRDLSAKTVQFQEFFAHSSFLKVISAILVAIVACSSLLFGATNAEAMSLIAIATIYCGFNALMVHCRFVFRAFEVMQYEARSIVIEKVLILLLCGGVLYFGGKTKLFLGAFSGAYVITFLATFYMLARNIGLPRWSINWQYLWKRIIKPAAPYALMSFFMVVYFRSATLMLRWITGNEAQVGFYNAGYRIVESFLLFPAVIVGPMYPSFSRRRTEKQYVGSLLYQASRVLLVISISMAVPIALMREAVTGIFYGPEYAAASAPVGILVIAVIPLGMSWVFGSLVAASGRQSWMNVVILFVTLANIVGHYMLIPRWGLQGASWVTLGTEFAIACGNLWFVRDYVQGRGFLALYLKGLCIGVVPLVFDQLGLLPQALVLRLTAVMVMLGGLFLVFRLVTFADIRRLMSRGVLQPLSTTPSELPGE